MQHQKIAEPPTAEDARDWKRITLDRPALSSFPPGELQGWALKLSTSVVSPWDKRWFILCGNFVCYFPSQDPSSRCSGCYFIPGMIVERLAEIPNHPSAPVHFNSYKPNCVLFRPVVPRKPGGEYKDLILSLPNETELAKWETLVSAVARTGALKRQGSSPHGGQQHASPLRVTPSSPTSPGSPSSSSANGRKFSAGSPAPAMPAHYKAMLKFSGISAEEAASNSEAVLSVLHFAEKHQADKLHPTIPENRPVHSPPPLPPGANVPKKEKYQLSELLTNANPHDTHSDLVKVDSGSQGEVYRATDNATGEVVALKKIFIKNEEKELPALENEISMMFTSKHQNIVNFYAAHRTDDTLWIAMEYMSGGKLTDVLDNHVKFTEEQVAYICKNVIQGLAYIHSMGRIHRDIKSDNILINAKGDVKLGDFGFCAALSEGENLKRKTVVGTPYWMAPEVIKGEPYDYKADVWSMGILALELCDGEPPLMDLPPMRALYVIVTQAAPKVKQSEKWSKSCRHFMESMLQKDPQQRPNAWDLLHHPFLNKASGTSGAFFEKLLL